jgi:hypothetical protein
MKPYDLDEFLFYNLKYPAQESKRISLRQLRAILSYSHIESLHRESLEFRKEMQICLNILKDNKFKEISYSDIPICQKLENDQNHRIPFSIILDTYCMPVEVFNVTK